MKMAPVPTSLLPTSAKGLVFDCDGTLLDTMPNHYKAWKAACAKHDLVLPIEEFLGYAGKPTEEIFDIICTKQGKSVNKQQFIIDKQAVYTQIMESCEVEVIPAVVEIVKAGKMLGLPMAVASGGSRKHVIHNLEAAGLTSYFSAIVTSEDVERGKPAPDIFLLAAKKLDVLAADCVGYEDAVLGMDAIQNAGFLAAVDVTKMDGYPHFADN